MTRPLCIYHGNCLAEFRAALGWEGYINLR